MYQITLFNRHGRKPGQGKYKTEKGALKAIYQWLVIHKQDKSAHALFISPEKGTINYQHCEQVPYSSPKQSDFYQSKAWLAIRVEALKTYDRACCLCGASGKGVEFHVDHIKPRSTHPHLALDINNLQILCKACNLGKSNKHTDDWR